MTDRDKVLRDLGRLMAGLAVPVSIGVRSLGTARDAWADLHRELAGFGWQSAGDYERALRKALGPGTREAEALFSEARQFLADQLAVSLDEGQISAALAREWLDAGAEALAEARAETARLKAELDKYQGRTAYHATEASLDDAARTLVLEGSLKPGDILRATDTGLERAWNGAGWELRT